MSLAAENALPGDVLYNIKVNINEEVRSALSVSAEAKAQWEARRAERRLEEAEKLAAKGELDMEKRERLEERFEEFAKRVEERIAELEANDKIQAAAEVISGLETAINAHAKILARISETENGEVELLAEKIKTHAVKTAGIRAEVESKLSNPESQTAAEGKLKATEKKISEVREFIAKSEVSAEVKSAAETKLKKAEDLVAEGKLKMETGAYAEAFRIFQEAHREAQEAKVEVAVKAELHLNGEGQKEESVEDNLVTFKSGVFTPTTMRVEIGDELTFVNNGPGPMWIASDPHPVHTSFPAFESGRLEPGGAYKFTFTESGTINYHNHLGPSAKGTIIVE